MITRKTIPEPPTPPPVPHEMSIEDRLKASVKRVKPPEPPITPPPSKEEETVPELTAIITDRKTQLELVRYLTKERELAEAEIVAKRERKPLTRRIKDILGKNKVSRALWEGWTINYYATDGRVTIKEIDLVNALLAAGLKDEQIHSIKSACVKYGKPSYTLRIQKPDEKEEDENGEY